MKQKSSKRKLYIAVPAVLVLVIIGAFFFWASSSSTGTISESTEAKQVQAPAFKDFNGKSITFQHKGTYQPQTLEAKDLDLELHMLRATTIYNKQLAVAVSQSPMAVLRLTRATCCARASRRCIPSAPLLLPVHLLCCGLKADGTEQTAFMANRNKIAILSFTTAGNADNLDPEVDALLKTFRWK